MAKAAEWAERVKEWKASGERSREFCEGRGYSPKQLLWWSSQLRRRGSAKPNRSTVKLARVVRRAEHGATRSQSEAASSGASSGVVIEWHGARVRVERDADRGTLGMVLDAVRASATGAAR